MLMYRSFSQALKMFSQLASAGKAGTGRAAVVRFPAGMVFSRHVQHPRAGPEYAKFLAAVVIYVSYVSVW